MNNEIMTIDQFAEELGAVIHVFLPEEYNEAEIQITEVTKNNGKRKTAITIRKKEEKIAPTIYLDEFYEKYKEGMDMEKIIRKVAEIRTKAEEKNFNIDEMLKEEYIRKNVQAMLVKQKGNEEMLKDLVWTPFNDLAIVYKVKVSNEEEGEASYKIKKSLLEKVNIKKAELRNLAFNNMHVQNGPEFKTMIEVLCQIMKIEDPKEAGMDTDDDTMFVLSNETKVHGAVWIADKHVLNAILKTLECERIAILPSSIHEVIILKYDEGHPPINELLRMVEEVNNTQVSPEEILSYNVYLYDKENGMIVADEDYLENE